MYKYNFSVIIPAYNTEQYIAETLNSVISQDIGFSENIQIIIVNDGSFDATEKICLQFVKRYPENITYIMQKNGGVSSARNHGLQYAEGKYINFLDSDDCWNKDAFKVVYNFFESNTESFDFLACRKYNFGREEGFYDANDWKFDQDKIIDLDKDYNQITTGLANAFVRHDSIRGMQFDTRLTISEDLTFIGKLLLEKKRCAILRSAVYNYRKREERSSALDTKLYTKSYYEGPEHSYMELIKTSINKYGKVEKFIQATIIYDLFWRIRDKIPSSVMTKDEILKYKNLLFKILSYVDDELIATKRDTNVVYKIFMLRFKYNHNIENAFNENNGFYFYKNYKLANLRSPARFHITRCSISNDKMFLKGFTDYSAFKDIKVYTKLNEELIDNIVIHDLPAKSIKSFDDSIIRRGSYFIAEIPIKKNPRIQFVIETRSGKYVITPRWGVRCILNGFMKNGYYCDGKRLIKCRKKQIDIHNYSKKDRSRLEKKYLKSLYDEFKSLKPILLRKCYFLMKKLLRKPVWIISDRYTNANDNGEALFRFLMDSDIKNKYYIFFAINKDTKSYQVLKKIGNVLDYHSFKYKLYFLLSSKIISSHADEYIVDAFLGNGNYFRDLYNFDFIFLQHGVTQNDLSGWLNVLNKDIKLFITTSERERNIILNGENGYSVKEVVLTGFPRHDRLLNENVTSKKILISPTWRKNLVGVKADNFQDEHYNPQFVNSDYYKFFNTLINNDNLINLLKKYGYTCDFLLHPKFLNQSKDFCSNEFVNIIHDEPNYSKIVSGSSLLITDYSSIQYEFIYLRKPIILTRFDDDEIQEVHTWKKLETPQEQLGPICLDIESTISEIQRYIQNDCKMVPPYKNYADNFFAFHDNNNSKRVVDSIANFDIGLDTLNETKKKRRI